MVQTRGSKQKTPASAPSSAAGRATASRRVKNKVGSPTPKKKPPILPLPSPGRSEGEEQYSSDELDYEAEEDPTSEQPQASDSSTSSTGSKREKLPGHVLSQLAADIHARGGIDKFSLESEQALAVLCDQRPELCGTRGSKLRLRVRKKVYRWKEKQKQNPLAWLQTIKDLQVTEKPTKAQLDKLNERSQNTSKKVKEEPKTEQINASVASVSQVPSSISVATMSNDEDEQAHFNTRNIDPDLLLPEGAELSKYLRQPMSSHNFLC